MNIENIMIWILGGGMVGLIGLLLSSINDQNRKIGRTYERLDEVKEYQDQNFTRKDICCIQHKQIMEKFAEIQSDLRVLIKDLGVQR